MQSLRKQLPPLDPLVAFEAAARHLSFTRAAEELHLSQAAVSQKIRNLEEHLGVELFYRSHRAVTLSPQGREFQHTVSVVLQQLASATSELRVSSSRSRLTLAADQSVSAMWLVPRLPHFQQLYPDVSVRLITSDEERDSLADDIEIAVVHGNGSWSGYNAEQLFEEEIFPVCSSEYLANRGNLISLSSLADETLLELEDSHWNWMNWRTWLSKKEVHLPAHHHGLRMNNYPLLIEAAKNGQGIALGWRYLVDSDLASGLLVRPLNSSVRTAYGYYLVWSDRKKLSTTASDFCAWVKNQLEQQRESNNLG